MSTRRTALVTVVATAIASALVVVAAEEVEGSKHAPLPGQAHNATGRVLDRSEPHTFRLHMGERTERKRIVPPKSTPPKSTPKPKKASYTISNYANCTGHAQSCIDAGKLTMYNGNYLAGHNYMGYQWLSRVPVGATVRVTSGPLAGTYRVYSHLRLNRQGGAFPSTGGADLVLQSCESNGTGFSLANRI